MTTIISGNNIVKESYFLSIMLTEYDESKGEIFNLQYGNVRKIVYMIYPNKGKIRVFLNFEDILFLYTITSIVFISMHGPINISEITHSMPISLGIQSGPFGSSQLIMNN